MSPLTPDQLRRTLEEDYREYPLQAAHQLPVTTRLYKRPIDLISRAVLQVKNPQLAAELSRTEDILAILQIEKQEQEKNICAVKGIEQRLDRLSFYDAMDVQTRAEMNQKLNGLFQDVKEIKATADAIEQQNHKRRLEDEEFRQNFKRDRLDVSHLDYSDLTKEVEEDSKDTDAMSKVCDDLKKESLENQANMQCRIEEQNKLEKDFEQIREEQQITRNQNREIDEGCERVKNQLQVFDDTYQRVVHNHQKIDEGCERVKNQLQKYGEGNERIQNKLQTYDEGCERIQNKLQTYDEGCERLTKGIQEVKEDGQRIAAKQKELRERLEKNDETLDELAKMIGKDKIYSAEEIQGKKRKNASVISKQVARDLKKIEDNLLRSEDKQEKDQQIMSEIFRRIEERDRIEKAQKIVKVSLEEEEWSETGEEDRQVEENQNLLQSEEITYAQHEIASILSTKNNSNQYIDLPVKQDTKTCRKNLEKLADDDESFQNKLLATSILSLPLDLQPAAKVEIQVENIQKIEGLTPGDTSIQIEHSETTSPNLPIEQLKHVELPFIKKDIGDNNIQKPVSFLQSINIIFLIRWLLNTVYFNPKEKILAWSIFRRQD